MMTLLFTIATVINVTLSTVRVLCTTKGGKLLSAITNAVCYGFYPLIVMLTAKGTVPIAVNMLITGLVNFVCVYFIKYMEKRLTKDKLWLVKMTAPKDKFEMVKGYLQNAKISFSYIDIGKYVVFDTYCPTQKDTAEVQKICKTVKGKMFATENKL